MSSILDKLYGAGVWKVVASVGHFRDLPLKSLGVHRDQGYGLSYELHPDKLKIVKDIKGLAQQVGIANCYLATDLDREGESISFHLAQILGIPISQTKRVTFDEVTEKAIAAAVSNPRVLDMKLVSAQEGRRAIDRLTGYEISPLMSRKLGNRLSAGRVQSVALRLVVERERTIEAFKSKSDFRLKGEFLTPNGEGIKATYHQPFLTEDAIVSYLKASVQKTYAVANIEVKPLVRQPSPPFTTSTLQQDAIRKLSKKAGRWSAKKVMEVAQELFAKGHITYMRTDSPNLSQEAVEAIKEQVNTRLGASYFEARTFKAKQAAQEAHEAIRPTHFYHQQAGDTPDEQALYELIYRRAMASQMKPALFEQTTIFITSADPQDLFTAVAKVEKFNGYLAVYAEETDEEGEEETTSLKKIAKGDKLRCQKLVGRQTYSQPAKRYDEASLIRELEKRDIGRPSTYASIVGTIQARDYVRTDSIPASKLPSVIFTLENNKLEKKVFI
ncbi:MAG: type I DNA topoisomerase [Cytophagaceae bacterium]|nr:MAG: type I DNA topoisomerase [Cytophagaceae bacterium]